MAGIHALIIEDDKSSIEVLGQMLKEAKATHKAINRPLDLKREDMEAVDVVFLDLEMPNMNGYQVYEMLRNQFGVKVPIVTYTANANEKSVVRQKGFNGILTKPLDGSCFAGQLRRILAGEAVWDEC